MLLVLKNMCFFRGFWNRTPLIIFIIFALTSPNYWHECLFAGQSVIFTLVLSWTFFSNLTVSVCLVTFDLIQHLILLSFIYLHNIWTISRITVLDQIKHCFFFWFMFRDPGSDWDHRAFSLEVKASTPLQFAAR